MFTTCAHNAGLACGVMLMCAVFFAMVSCSGDQEKPVPGASVPVPENSMQALLDALDSKTETVVIGDQDGPNLVITPELSARVLGASLKGTTDENLMWVNKSIMDGSYWDSRPLDWNSGGLRTWLSPEDIFFLDADYDASKWFVPGEMDPLACTVTRKGPNEVTFFAEADIPANIGKSYRVDLSGSIKLVTEPVSDVAPLPDGVEFLGIVKTHTITNKGELVIGDDLPYVTLWSLFQINPSGTILIPIKPGYDADKAWRAYFNPLGDRLTVQNDIISVKIDGKYRSKVGVRPEAARNGLAFMRDNGDGTGILYAQRFEVNPDGIYTDKPWGTDTYGDAIEMYNDDGNGGGFTEIEAHSQALKMGQGDSQSHTIELLIFRGPLTDLKSIATKLYDADFNGAYYYPVQ